VISGSLCFLPPSVDPDAWAYVRWRGALHEIDGEPARVAGPRGIHHIEANLRRVR
jgi:hypothetical protein